MFGCEIASPAFSLFCRHQRGRREKSAMRINLTSVGVCNSNICYLAAPIPRISLSKVVDDFASFIDLTVQEETNKLCVALWVVFDATPAISLHQLLSRQNFGYPSYYWCQRFCCTHYIPQISLSSLSQGVNDLTFSVGTRVEEETNKLCVAL